MRRRVKCNKLVIVIGMLSIWGFAHGGSQTKLVVFGDSLSDPGNYFAETGEFVQAPFEPVPAAPYAIGGFHFSDGSTWVEQLSVRLKAPTGSGPAALVPGVFTNYAFGRSRARPDAVFPLYHLGDQVERFLDDFGGQATEGALYVIWAGSNDVRDALGALAGDPSGATSNAIIEAALGAIGDAMFDLIDTGAQKFLIVNVPNLGRTPAVQAFGAQNPAIPVLAEQLATGFNTGLDATLDFIELTTGVEIHRLDSFAVIESIVADPSAAGLSDVTEPCLEFGVVAGAVCSFPDSHLFWDGAHPTRKGHTALAEAARELLSTP